MNLITQPPGSSLCGQACVAMIAGISLEESIKIFGHSHSSKTKQIIKALKSLGIYPSERLKRFSQLKRWPQRAIIREIYKVPGRKQGSFRINGHFVLLWDGYIYDPDPHKNTVMTHFDFSDLRFCLTLTAIFATMYA